MAKNTYRAIITLEFPTEWATREQAAEWARAWIDHFKTDRRLNEHKGVMDYAVYAAAGSIMIDFPYSEEIV